MKNIPPHSVASVLNELFCCDEKIIRHPPRVLILYGSLREKSYSRFAAIEASKILESFGAEVRIFNPNDLPLGVL